MKKILEFMKRDQHYVFNVDNFVIKRNIGVELDFGDYQITDEKGNIITDFGEHWTGKWSGSSVIESVICSYINGSQSINVFFACDELKSIKDSYLTAVITVKGKEYRTKACIEGSDMDLELQMITQDGDTFYSNGESFLLLDTKRDPVTTYEHFYLNRCMEIFSDHEYIWIDPYLEEAIKEYK